MGKIKWNGQRNELKRYRYVYKRTCYANTKQSSENRPIKHDLGARNKFAYDRVKIPITERRSPDIQRRKPINTKRVCEVVIRELAHADDMVLPGKVRGELIKLYYQNGMNAAEALRVYHRNHRQRRGPGTLQALRDLVRKFEDTGCTCNKPRSGRPTVSEDVVMEVTTIQSPYSDCRTHRNRKRHSACVGYPELNGPQALALGTSHVSLSVQARPDVGAG
ncbi:hypothetical protein TNCV_1689621 [Trichonephila clavipes]|nr:hypothetical protein TNCV_1689621 [Trichonephila clavipes]